MDLKEILVNYNKGMVYDYYVKIVEEPKDYDRITRNKMIDAIILEYSDYNNIISICTVRELKFLKKVIDNNSDLLDWDYEWEIRTLIGKLLIFNTFDGVCIVEDFYDSVVAAIKNAKWSRLKKRDRIIECGIGLCKVYAMLPSGVLIFLISDMLDIDRDTVANCFIENKIFQYYIYYDVEYISCLGEELLFLIYRDYVDFLYELDLVKKMSEKEDFYGVMVSDVVSIFYNDFNVNDRKIKKFYNELRNINYNDFLVDRIIYCIVLNKSREELYYLVEKIYGSQIRDVDKFIELLDYTLDNSPSAALKGLSLVEYKSISC